MSQSFDPRTHTLGITQIINWGILFYTPALLSKPIALDTGFSLAFVYGAFSLSLLIGGLCAALVGGWLDSYGGRLIMSLGTIIAAISLIIWALSYNHATYIIASILLGFSMRLTLYEAAFASLVERLGEKARLHISIVTLYGALASSILWGITYYLENFYGWRITLFIFASVLLLISLPLHWFFMPAFQLHEKTYVSENDEPYLVSSEKRRNAIILFALTLTLSSFVFASLAIHLITFLNGLGMSLATAVYIASLKGVAQFVGRLAEMIWGQSLHPLTIAIIASLLLMLSFLCLGFNAFILYVLFYGVGQGLLTIVRGAVPLVLFGRKGYGALSGKIIMPSLIITATTPLLFGLYLEQYGAQSGLYLLLFISFLALISTGLLYKYTRS